MTRTAVARSSYNGDVLPLFLILILLSVASQPAFGFGLAPTHRHKAFSSGSSRHYFSWRYTYQGRHTRRKSGSGALSPIFSTTEDTGSDSSKNTTTTAAKKSPGKTNKSKKSTKKSTKTPISYLANDANLSSLTKDNPTWDQNIAALLEYNQTYGTVNLPEKSKYYPNLGQWVHNLRLMKGRLTKEQIQQLDDIGFLWKESRKEKDDRQWDEMFLRLQAFKEKYGHCRVPSVWDEDQSLAYWVKNQRQKYTDNNIREDRKMMLDSIGFAWRLMPFYERDRPDLEDLWEERYHELIQFKEEHNHANVPRDYPPNKELGYWVNTQRAWKKDGTLREDRIPRLDKIGFIWEFEPIWDESWLEKYQELKTHLQELAIYKEVIKNSPEGSVAVPKPVLSDRLHYWAAQQRMSNARGDMGPERKAMLDDIGFEWWE